MVTSVHVSFSFAVVLCGRSLRRRSREEPDREARPGTHEEMDDDEEEKAESLSNLNGLCLCSYWIGRDDAGQASGRRIYPFHLLLWICLVSLGCWLSLNV